MLWLSSRTDRRTRALRCVAAWSLVLTGGAAAALAAAVAPLAGQPPAAMQLALRDLPLVEVPPIVGVSTPATPPSERSLAPRSLAILMTGDGNWAPIDKGIADALVHGEVPVVGFKSREYLESGRRTPEGLTHDIERVARTYMARWGRDHLILLGFSRGADFVPFVINRLAPDLRDRVVVAGMYGAEQAASFEFHFTDLFSDRHRATDLPVAPELDRLGAYPALRVFCVYGADEQDSSCRNAPSTVVHKIERGGAHHFDKHYPELGRLVLDELGSGARGPSAAARGASGR